ncbi:DUF3098 domain-containing protein [Hymenobacter sp. ASUV-10]|uniref:DUF3098 domain-containing protein n=1 Tax=Hymenobacter aranciens TaxID=3063996 RepID=A0ABT9BFD1_9BACT|nr:DUF3098 domain-containing protein [Hymenobacter sp. ASUV-10]MDO7876952.1 DUF3098 domain-containing protein [Hymenobacter sp. ASUV-10]
MNPTPPAPRFAFGPRNFRLMWIGLALLAIGFITMMFGDKENYGEDFVGITLGPLLLVIGFGIEFAAIMVRDKNLVVTAPISAPVAPTSGITPPPVAPVVAPTPAPAPTYKRP